MIGAAVLVTGLLLILAGLASARIPGGATFARPGIDRSEGAGADATGLFAFARRARNPVRAFALSPIHPATWYANAAIALGLVVGVAAFATIAALVSGGLATILAVVGLVFLAMAIAPAGTTRCSTSSAGRNRSIRASVPKTISRTPNRVAHCP